MNILLSEVSLAYINLEEEVDKNNQMIQMLEKIGIKQYKKIHAEKAEIYPLKSKKQKFAKRLAIAKSHKKALDSFDATPFLILEDDCILINDIKEIEVPDDADIVLLGIWEEKELRQFSGIEYLDHKIYENVSDTIVRANKMNGMHAVLYVSSRSKDLAQRVFDLCPKTNRHIDNLFRTLTPFINVYALKKPIFAQTSQIKETNIEITM
jgi:hypothetical protein